jgi:hypothetical protein
MTDPDPARPAPVTSDPIDGVLARLDEILAESLATASRAGYFAALYRRVTATVKGRIGTGFFDDDARMETLDATFATRYLDAYGAWKNGGAGLTAPWQVAFDAVGNPSLILLQQLLVGMNAHITFDLGVAAAEVAETPAGLRSMQADFDRINCLLACLVPTVFAEIGELSPLIHLLEKLDDAGEESFVDDLMKVFRDFAWVFANELVYFQPVPDLRQDAWNLRERESARLGRFVVDPGPLARSVVHAIWWAESKDVRKNIHVLAAPAQLPAGCLDACRTPQRVPTSKP